MPSGLPIANASSQSISRRPRLTWPHSPVVHQGYHPLSSIVVPLERTRCDNSSGWCRARRVATRCSRAKDSVDCPAVGGIPNHRRPARRGARCLNEELACRPWKHGPGHSLGRLVLGPLELLDPRLVGVVVHRRFGAAYAGDRVAYRVESLSPEEGAQWGLTCAPRGRGRRGLMFCRAVAAQERTDLAHFSFAAENAD